MLWNRFWGGISLIEDGGLLLWVTPTGLKAAACWNGEVLEQWAKTSGPLCFSSTRVGREWDLYSEGPECPAHDPWEGEMEQKRKMLNQ